LKEEADGVFNALGMNLTTAITVFVRQAVRQRKIPFEISLDTTDSGRKVTMVEAMAASERIWQASIQNGTDKITMDDINAEIAAARRERKTKAVK
jgi:addiction module RelB/DinJ family antitoxin